MGLILAEITISNPVKSDLKSLSTRCLIDTCCTYLVIPEHVALQLQLAILETKEETTPDGSSHSIPYTEPVRVSFDNRSCFVRAIIMGNEVLLGAFQMEDMDLIVQPKLLKLSVNPESPNIAKEFVK